MPDSPFAHIPINPERLRQQLDFIIEIEKLKGVIRRSPLFGIERMENSAEHSWHLAMMALLLAEHANEPVDQARVIKMILIHDIVEIDADDTYCYDEVGAIDKEEREAKAADRLFNILPADQAREFHSLWDEFEARESADARFAVALDRTMPLFQSYLAQGKTWHENQIVKAQVLTRNSPTRDGSEVLWGVVSTLIDEAVERGYLNE